MCKDETTKAVDPSLRDAQQGMQDAQSDLNHLGRNMRTETLEHGVEARIRTVYENIQRSHQQADDLGRLRQLMSQYPGVAELVQLMRKYIF